MTMRSLKHALLSALLVSTAAAQLPPTPEGVKIVQSRFHKGVKISYKEPGICETTPGVRSYAGYVHLPKNFLVGEWEGKQDYPINTFFWFFEAREDPANAPLSIWLNGGPGGSSMIGGMAENGPCFINRDSNSTTINQWSWNNKVNMLYIDQPVQVGYSYDYPTNGTVNIDPTTEFPFVPVEADFSKGIPEQNNTFYVGTFPSNNPKHTANSTAHAAHAIWHFAQTWFEEFPFYKPNDERVSMWTESYGGVYGPSFVKFFQEQNHKIQNGTIKTPGAHVIKLDTLGIINGCIDLLHQSSSYADMAFNNTYGIKAINQSQYDTMIHGYVKKGGCRDKTLACQKAARNDPRDIGDIDKINKLCRDANQCEEENFILPYFETADNGWFDIAHPSHDPFPEPYFQGFLNQHWVQKALGVPVNFTESSEGVALSFGMTGDMSRGHMLENIGYLLDEGIKVALVYGDRDFACNWIGGERSSLGIKWDGIEDFRTAGYIPFWANGLNIAGQVRQFGNLSFTRVYQAGHMVPSYQPEASYELFMRSLSNVDMATGQFPLYDTYKTPGPRDTWHIKNIPPSRPEPVCYVLTPESCSDEQFAAVMNGTAIVKDFIVVGVEEDHHRLEHEQKQSQEEQQRPCMEEEETSEESAIAAGGWQTGQKVLQEL